MNDAENADFESRLQPLPAEVAEALKRTEANDWIASSSDVKTLAAAYRAAMAELEAIKTLVNHLASVR